MRNARRGRILAASWMSVGFALSACSAWLVAGRFFVVDLAVSYQHLLVLAVLVWAGVLVCLGRRWPGFVCLLAAAVGVMPLAAGRSVYLPGVDLEAPPAPGLVRVVSFNIGPLNERWEADYARALGVHADVVVLLEVPWVLSRPILRQGSLDGTGWSWLHRDWVADLASPCFLLSRWPMERVDLPEVEHSERDILLARIDHPAGQFLLAGAHPHSPRTVDRWVLGNTILGRTLDALESDRSRQGLALVLGTDINSAPTGSRARAARRSGLRMGKPLTGGVGSFPSQWPGVARVQLDDVWVAGGASVVAWSSVESLGSDHTMIVVDVRLPGAGTGGDSDMGE